MKFLTWLGLDILVFLIIASIIGIVLWVRVDAAPPVVDYTEPPTHFMLEYKMDGTRHVRTMSLFNARVIEGVAKDLGIHPSHLLAMCILESSVPNPDGNYYACDPEAVGDNGKALGAFQIHQGYHNVKTEDAKHIYFSAVWTAERLIQKGYFHNKERAIRCHNSCNPNNRYGQKVLQIAKTLKPIN